jgi:O-antigen/teichoic acid export membrane protein
MSDGGFDPLELAEPTAAAPFDVPPSAPGQRIAQNTVAIGLSAIAARGLMFLWQLILARALGAEGYGVYGTIGALLAVGATIPDLGMGLIVIREVANRPQDAGRYLGATLTLQPFLAALGYGFLMLAAFLLGYDMRLRWLLVLVAVNLLVDVLGNMCHNQLLAAERMMAPALISVVHVVLVMTLGGMAIAAGWGLWGLYAAILLAGIGRSTAYGITLRRTGCRPVLPADRTLVRGLLVNGLPLALTGFLSLATMHADKLITTALIGAESTGYLTAAFVIVFGVVELINTTMLVVTFPALSRASAARQTGVVEWLVEKLIFFNLLFGLPLAVCVTLFGVPLSRWIFGQGFSRTGEVLSVLIWFAVVTMATNIFAQVLVGQNRQVRLVTVRAAGLAANIAISLALIPRLGVSGAALAALLAEMLVVVGLILSVRLPASWWAGFSGRLWRLGAASLALAAIALWLRTIHPLLAASIGVPAYSAVILLSGAMAREDWVILRRLLAAMPGPAALRRYWSQLAI